jgi:hypothetical protein
MEKTTIIVKTDYGNGEKRKAIFSDGSAGHTITEFINTFIRPLLLTVGYSEERVNEALGEE